MALTSPRFKGEPTLEACAAGTHRMLTPEQGIAVRIVQEALLELGFALPSGADGAFGDETTEAVHQFKRLNSIFPDDGVVGPKTMNALNAMFQVVDIFQPFVAAGRVDRGVADLLNELHVFSNTSFAKETAHFAFVELSNGNCAGLVRASQANALIPFVPASGHAELAAYQAAGNIGNNGETPAVEENGVVTGYSIFRDDVAAGANRFFSYLVVAHELTHFRNRILFKDLYSQAAFDPINYVDPALAAASGGAGFQPTNATRAYYCDEIACRHVAWHVGQDLRHLGYETKAGQIFLAASQFADLAAAPNQDYYDSGYMAALKPRPADFNRQVATWLAQPIATRELFHSDPGIQGDLQVVLAAEAAFAFNVGFVFPPGLTPDGLA